MRRPAPIVAARGMTAPLCLVISCEHGGRDVPPAYAALFRGHEALLDTHRGWDPGALDLAQQMADAFAVPLHAATTTRLLIDLNRSIGHRQLYSEFTRGLDRVRREAIVRDHYRPHRDAVETRIGQLIEAGCRVIHVASHSFTPSLNGVVRRADLAWLYDPRRPGEVRLAGQWLAAVAALAPGLALRRNYPYQGRGDGLTALLRTRHGDTDYVGIELEVNQRFVAAGGQPWQAVRTALIESLATVLGLSRTG